MGRIRFNTKYFMALLVGAAMFSCSDDALMEVPQVLEESKDTYVATITAGLGNDNVESRLSYEWLDKKGVKMLWDKDDQLVANPTPSSADNAFVFKLKEGEGTVNGTFECATFSQVNSNAWAIYYPGSKVQSDADYLAWSYIGQTQKGNNNMDHLKDKHSMRVTYYTDPNLNQSRPFEHAMIDFSAEGVEQSSCMKFNLSGFSTKITPEKLELVYYNPQGGIEPLFYKFNLPSLRFSNYTTEKLSSMTLSLSGFSATNSITAYMMMSNATMSVSNGGKFRVYVTTTTGARYYGDVAITKNVNLKGGKIYSITCKSWKEMDQNDAFVNPSVGVTVLQEAKEGNGTDIIIMGDGFDKTHFGTDGDYDDLMEEAYNNFFSVEPYASLKGYFNVYYINAVSEEDHDAIPQDNGAIQGDAVTIFNTQFVSGTTSIKGNNSMVLEYAKQAIRTKGGKNGAAVTDESVISRRAQTALMMVQVNVKCHAGTCSLSWSSEYDYGYGYSVAYTALNTSNYGRRWTTIHEAGGHGFGKLADEYGGNYITSFSTDKWKELNEIHSCGVNRNVNEYWNSSVETGWGDLSWIETTNENVYWSALLNTYEYKNELEVSGKGEGLGIYRGANTYDNLYCRPTKNSVMRSQFDTNGNFFNAISRWAIWYRVMKLTGTKSYKNFESSLNDFIEFDEGLTIIKNAPEGRGVLDLKELKPLAPPVLIKGEWINGCLVLEK